MITARKIGFKHSVGSVTCNLRPEKNGFVFLVPKICRCSAKHILLIESGMV